MILRVRRFTETFSKNNLRQPFWDTGFWDTKYFLVKIENLFLMALAMHLPSAVKESKNKILSESEKGIIEIDHTVISSA